MQFTRGNVGIIYTIKIKAFKQFLEFRHVIRQEGRVHGSVFNYSHWFGITGYIGKQAKPCFSQSPDFSDITTSNHREMIAVTLFPHGLLQIYDPLHEFLFGFACKLYDQNGSRFALDEKAVFTLFDVVGSLLNDNMIHEFHRNGAMLKRHKVAAKSLFQ